MKSDCHMKFHVTEYVTKELPQPGFAPIHTKNNLRNFNPFPMILASFSIVLNCVNEVNYGGV